MLSPVATFDQMKTLLAFGECCMKQGIKIPEHLQPLIDRPEYYPRYVRWVAAGMPDSDVSMTPFEEPESHHMARKILGEDFLGIPAAQRHFGRYTEAQLAARLEIPFSEKTLRECAGKFVLVATHELDLPAIHGAHPERFNDDPDYPWFGSNDQREKWSAQQITDPWLFVRKSILPDSGSRNIDEQKKHLETFPHERFILPCEFGYSALLLLLETRQMLCERNVVRFHLQTVAGLWIRVEWVKRKLHFYCGYNIHSSGTLGSGSVRTS